MRVLPTILCGTLLAACQSTTTSPSEGPDKSDVVSAASAATLFANVCGASLPKFSSAKSKMAKYGFTAKSPAGTSTMYSTSLDASFQVLEGPGLGKTCSFVFASNDSFNATERAFEAVAGHEFKQTQIGYGTLYKTSSALIFLKKPNTLNGQKYYNVRLLSER